MGKSILIVANGNSVAHRKLGADIDGFSLVGRINNYRTAGFEDFAGSTTDIWFNGANQGLRRRSRPPGTIIVMIPAEILERKGDLIHHRIEKRLGVKQGEYELASLAEMRKIEELCGVPRPTTGTNSILWALSRFEQVVIHGFDFFMDSKSHYFDSRLKKGLIERGMLKKAGKHDIESEKRCIDSLIAEGSVQKLVDIL